MRGIARVFRQKGRAAIVQNVGPMFQMMFTDQPAIRDYRDFCRHVDRAAFPEIRVVAVPVRRLRLAVGGAALDRNAGPY